MSKKETYRIKLICRNCGYEEVKMKPKGESRCDMLCCPNCGCITAKEVMAGSH
jgi:peptide subunit release factor 1 (eRF1)